jgi:hypothetical protein
MQPRLLPVHDATCLTYGDRPVRSVRLSGAMLT